LGRNSAFIFSLPWLMMVLPMMPTPLRSGAAAGGQRLVQQVLVDSVPSWPPYSSGQVIPAIPAPQLGHEGATQGRVDDLGHVLPGHVEDLGVVVVVEELLHVLDELELLGVNSKSMVRPPSSDCGAYRCGYLTDRQILWTS